MDSRKVTITASVKSLEALLILVAKQGGREPAGVSEFRVTRRVCENWPKM
jgi:hypothetical protein